MIIITERRLMKIMKVFPVIYSYRFFLFIYVLNNLPLVCLFVFIYEMYYLEASQTSKHVIHINNVSVKEKDLNKHEREGD